MVKSTRYPSAHEAVWVPGVTGTKAEDSAIGALDAADSAVEAAMVIMMIILHRLITAARWSGRAMMEMMMRYFFTMA